MNLIEFLLMEDEVPVDTVVLSAEAIGKIHSNIRTGAKAQDEDWRDAQHLCDKAYTVVGVEIPKVTTKEAWAQYMENLTFAVKQLQLERPHTDKWRLTPPTTIKENDMKLSELLESNAPLTIKVDTAEVSMDKYIYNSIRASAVKYKGVKIGDKLKLVDHQNGKAFGVGTVVMRVPRGQYVNLLVDFAASPKKYNVKRRLNTVDGTH